MAQDVELPAELSAMAAIETAFAALNEDEKARVLTWARSKFGGGPQSAVEPEEGDGGASNRGDSTPEQQESQNFAELFYRASPKTENDKVLVATYWFQKGEDKTHVTGQEVNSALKQLGHGTRNVTDRFTSLMNRKPALVQQVGKTGSSRQARKRYRLTGEGAKQVERWLSGQAE